MTIKKKLLIALLSTTCVAAGVAGLAACTDKSGNDSYTVSAIDQNGNAVQGVVFRIGYYNEENYSTDYVTDKNGKTLTATTDKNGKATFKGFKPEEGVTYSAYIADLDDERAYPYGYRNENMSVDFDAKHHATYEFKYLPSSYFDNLVSGLDYKRTFDDSDYVEGNDSTMKYVEEGSKTLTLSLKKDVHSYFSFLSYKELGSAGAASDDEISERVFYNQLWGTKAAAGVYTVSFTTTSNTSVTMYNFNGSGYVATDDDGIPSNKIETQNGKAGSITLELTVYDYNSRATQYFGLYSSADCNVTVTVERTGDAEEPAEIETTKVEAPQGLTQYGAQSGTLTLMNVDGSLAAVLGADNLYHIGSAAGPILHINLTEAIERVGELSIMDLTSDKNPAAATGHIFSKYEDGELTAIYDYSDFLAAYAEKVNADGVYPVNKDVYDFLQLYAATGQMMDAALAGDYAWLLPCQYYAPADGLEVTGAGTQADPYVLLGLLNKVSSLEGSEAYFTYTATADGIYSFKLDATNMFANLEVVEDDINNFAEENDNFDLITYVVLKENQSVTLKLTEFFTSASIDVANAAANTVKAQSGDETDSKGLNADNAIQLNYTGYTAYVVDSSVNAEGVWVCVPMGFEDTEYKIEVKGSPDAKIIYGDDTYGDGDTFELICESGQKCAFLLTSEDDQGNVVDGIYAIDWQVVEAEEDNGIALEEGVNEITISAADLYWGVKYSFTSAEGGEYTITTDNEDAQIFSPEFAEYVMGTGSYKFELEAGETFVFLCAGGGVEDLTYNVTIAPYVPTCDESFTDEGGTKQITLDSDNQDDGVEFVFLSTTGGTYTISVPDGAEAMIRTDSDPMSVVNTIINKNSYEFTLEAGEYVTFIAFVPNYDIGDYEVTIAKNS